jgi:hypothetical protein
MYCRKMTYFITRNLYKNHISENKIDIEKKEKYQSGAVRETYLQSKAVEGLGINNKMAY